VSTPDVIESLLRRVEALEAEQFLLVEQIRRAADVADRTAKGLDDLEEILTDVSLAAAEQTDAMEAAMTQRQAQLDGGTAGDTVTTTGDTGTAPGADPGAGSAALLVTSEPLPIRTGGSTGGGGMDAPDLRVLHAWVEAHIAPLVRKTTTTGEGGGIRWCRRWWEHHDAVERFIGLYLAYQELSGDESVTWLSVYLRDHLDPHIGVLTSPYGPFYACNPREHSDTFEALGQADITSPQPSGSHP
jgi:hypothetical protein